MATAKDSSFAKNLEKTLIIELYCNGALTALANRLEYRGQTKTAISFISVTEQVWLSNVLGTLKAHSEGMDQQLTTSQVAEALRVSESSIKRWCDRGVIPTVRTLGGHRRIPLAAFMQFLEDTDQQLQVPIQTIAATDVQPQRDQPFQLGKSVDEFVDALAQGDEKKCREIVSECFAQEDSIARLGDELFAPALHRLGEMWNCGDLAIYQERRSCEICSRLLFELRRLLVVPSEQAPVALGGSPSGDHYSMPSQLIELVLRQGGWQSSNLGVNIPLQSIALAAAKHRPKLVWISVSHVDEPQSFVEQFAEFHAKLPLGTSLIVGGRALDDKVRPKLSYTSFCDNLKQLRTFAEAIKR